MVRAPTCRQASADRRPLRGNEKAAPRVAFFSGPCLELNAWFAARGQAWREAPLI